MQRARASQVVVYGGRHGVGKEKVHPGMSDAGDEVRNGRHGRLHGSLKDHITVLSARDGHGRMGRIAALGYGEDGDLPRGLVDA